MSLWRFLLFQSVCEFVEVLCVCGGFYCFRVFVCVFVVVVCPPQRDLSLFLVGFESPCGGLSPYLSCI